MKRFSPFKQLDPLPWRCKLPCGRRTAPTHCVVQCCTEWFENDRYVAESHCRAGGDEPRLGWLIVDWHAVRICQDLGRDDWTILKSWDFVPIPTSVANLYQHIPMASLGSDICQMVDQTWYPSVQPCGSSPMPKRRRGNRPWGFSRRCEIGWDQRKEESSARKDC